MVMVIGLRAHYEYYPASREDTRHTRSVSAAGGNRHTRTYMFVYTSSVLLLLQAPDITGPAAPLHVTEALPLRQTHSRAAPSSASELAPSSEHWE